MNKHEYEKNINLLIKYAKAYYVDDEPLASDIEYDKLAKECYAYELNNKNNIHPNSPNWRVGDVVSSFTKKQHLSKMWSQEDIFTVDELYTWLENKGEYFLVEPKLDGVSLNLIYKNGELVEAITRGDGLVGEDVTANAKTIRSIPLTIEDKETIEVRGEVLIKQKDFDIINKEREKNNLSLFANPRNAASGSLRNKDPKVTSERKLVFYPWEMTKEGFNTQEEKIAYLNNLGFTNPYNKELLKTLNVINKTDKDNIYNVYKNILALRDKFEVGLDGVVIKINSIDLQNKFSYTSKYPKWSVAFKFPPVEQTTKILGVKHQVGRTGVITPVAMLEPIEIDDSVVSMVTLNNYDYIKENDIKIGDKILLIKSGDIIPKITKIFKDRRTGEEATIPIPDTCPSCNSLLTKDNALLKCKNSNCSGSIIKNVYHFGSREAINIEGLGSKIVELLFNNNKIKSPLDLFKLNYNSLSDLEGFKEKKINNLLEAINTKKEVTISRFIYALGINLVGEVASREISYKLKKNFIDAKEDDIKSIEGLGKEIANSYINFMSNNKEYVKELMKYINIVEDEIVSSKIENKNFLISGKLSRPRDEYKTMLKHKGANVISGVSSKLDYLVIGEGFKKGKDLIDDKYNIKEEHKSKYHFKVLKEKELYELLVN